MQVVLHHKKTWRHLHWSRPITLRTIVHACAHAEIFIVTLQQTIDHPSNPANAALIPQE